MLVSEKTKHYLRYSLISPLQTATVYWQTSSAVKTILEIPAMRFSIADIVGVLVRYVHRLDLLESMSLIA